MNHQTIEESSFPRGIHRVNSLPSVDHQQEVELNKELVDSHVESFISHVTSEVIKDVEESGCAKIIIPLRGGIFLYTKLFNTLVNSRKDILSKVKFVFATKDLLEKEKYHVDDPNPDEDLPIYLMDDIYDGGGSFRNIAIHYGESSLRIKKRYLCTKIHTNHRLNDNGGAPLMILPNEWFATLFGMNSGLLHNMEGTNFTPQDKILLELYERTSSEGLIINNGNTASELTSTWGQEDLNAYINLLISSNTLSFSEREILRSIYEKLILNENREPKELLRIMQSIHISRMVEGEVFTSTES